MISNEVIRTVVINQIEVIKELEVYHREIQIERAMPTIFVGIRRSGKSYMLYQLMRKFVALGHQWDEFLYVNFEDERLIGFDVSDFERLLSVHASLSNTRPILFLDEVQNIVGWQKFARRMADEKKIIYITGSNATMLSADMEAALGGRFLSVPVYPYSFEEFLVCQDFIWDERRIAIVKDKAKVVNLLSQYLEFGGFPEVQHLVDKRSYLSSIYNKVFLGDMMARNSVNNRLALEVLMKKLAETVRHSISFSRLSNVVRAVGVSVGKSTIIQYIDYAIDAQVIFSIKNYQTSLPEQTSNPKYYFMDTGLLNLFLVDSKPALFENLIALSLIRQYGKNAVCFYEHNIEVDFYIVEESLLIQASYTISDFETRRREVQSLVKAARHLKAKKCLIITFDDDEEIIIEDGVEIQVVPSWKWMLLEK